MFLQKRFTSTEQRCSTHYLMIAFIPEQQHCYQIEENKMGFDTGVDCVSD